MSNAKYMVTGIEYSTLTDAITQAKRVASMRFRELYKSRDFAARFTAEELAGTNVDVTREDGSIVYTSKP